MGRAKKGRNYAMPLRRLILTRYMAASALASRVWASWASRGNMLRPILAPHRIGFAVDVQRLLERQLQLLRNLLGGGVRIDVLAQHGKFVARQSRHRIDLAHSAADGSRRGLEHGVAHGMAQVVVDGFEIIQVHKQQRARPAAAARHLQCLRQLLLEHAAVGQAGQRVVVGQVGHGIAAGIELGHLQANLLLHVAETAGQITELIVPVHGQRPMGAPCENARVARTMDWSGPVTTRDTQAASNSPARHSASSTLRMLYPSPTTSLWITAMGCDKPTTRKRPSS